MVNNIWQQMIETRPKAKGRPQFNRRTGSAYTPQATREYEKLIGSLYTGPYFSEGLLEVKLRFNIDGTSLTIFRQPDHEVSKLTGDIDNYAKAILDGLNGVAFADDKQVVMLSLEKL